MKSRGRLAPLALVTLGLFVPAAPSRADSYPRQPGVDVVHYSFRLTLSDETDVIEGETSVEFRVVQEGLSSLTLDLVQPKPADPAKGMTVSAVTEGGAPRTFEHADDRLTIRLEPAGRAGERRTRRRALPRHPARPAC